MSSAIAIRMGHPSPRVIMGVAPIFTNGSRWISAVRSDLLRGLRRGRGSYGLSRATALAACYEVGSPRAPIVPAVAADIVVVRDSVLFENAVEHDAAVRQRILVRASPTNG